MRSISLTTFFVLIPGLWLTTGAPVRSNEKLVAAVRDGAEGSLIEIGPEVDHGNLISGLGKAPAKGPRSFHNNLASNRGRGVIWINEPDANLSVWNNRLISISDSDRYDDPPSDHRAGPEEPLSFQCGVHGELSVDGWETRPTEE